MLIKQESITSQKHGYQDFWQIANSVLNKCKSAILPVFNGPEVFSLASNKGQLFDNFFLRTLILITLVALYLFSLLDLI